MSTENVERSKPKFLAGDRVLVEGELVGVVISGYTPSYTERMGWKWLYRVVVDAKDCVYRAMRGKSQKGDELQFREDMGDLLFCTSSAYIVEIWEDKLVAFLYPIHIDDQVTSDDIGRSQSPL